MGAEKVAFYILSALTLGGGVAILFSVRIIRAIVYLLVSLFGVAGLYVLLHADFLAAVQVLIYIGGITILMVFGIMLTDAPKFQNPAANRLKAVSAGVSSLVCAAVLLIIIGRTAWPGAGSLSETAGEGTTAVIGRLLLTKNILAFEVVSVLLLVVLIGAALIIRLARQK